jgi:redox-sensitive bicupin YhaK (pirin superfamily)
LFGIELNVFVVLDQSGDGVQVKSEGKPVRFLLAAAKPLNEPMARYGPFVMNTQQEIYQAFQDYQNGVLQK